MKSDLEVQEVEDGAVVKAPDPDKIVIEQMRHTKSADGKLVEEIIRNEWVYAGSHVNPPWKEDEVSASLFFDVDDKASP
jgi:hypothetical protein